jgi:hypothetical protein
VRTVADVAPAVFVTPGSEQAEGSYGGTHVRRTYEITGFASPEAHPALSDHALVDLIIWDLRQVLETYDATLHGLVELMRFTGSRPGYREASSNVVGAAVTYELVYAVAVTAPDTAL